MGSCWRQLSSQLKYQSQYTAVYEDDVKIPDGTIIQYTRIDLPDFVTIVPILHDQIVMIYNYRYPVNEWSLELPSGFINQGEKPEKTALRELREETGYTPNRLRNLGWYYPMSARGKQKAYVFLAENLKTGKTQREKTEQQKICPMPKSKVYTKLFKGEIKHSATIIALTLASPQLNKDVVSVLAHTPAISPPNCSS